MPRIKRWSPISHDFNRDPQIIEMRKNFGDWTALAWQEVLHEADRNDGIVRGNIEQIALRLAPVSLQMYVKRAADTAQMMLRYCIDAGWIVAQVDCIHVVKFSKYHRTWEHKKLPTEPNLTRTDPNLTKPIRRVREDTSFEAKDPQWPCPKLLIEKYNSDTPDELPAVEKITPARIAKAKSYLKIFPDLEFWSEVFSETGKSTFLRGLRPANGHGSFRADFDWLLSKGKDGTENCVKVFEGRYRD